LGSFLSAVALAAEVDVVVLAEQIVAEAGAGALALFYMGLLLQLCGLKQFICE
jgi:hypothetical protein